MPSQTDVREVDTNKGRVSRRRKFGPKDFDHIAEYICDEFSRRKEKRKDREKQWDEIDRQLRMEPDLRHKHDKNGRKIDARAWMAEMELPLQAQTLEVLTADARRMIGPDGRWFAAHGAQTDALTEKLESKSLLVDERAELPSVITQDNIDKLVEGFLQAIHRQYEFGANLDEINAESFKYSLGLGRVRMVSKNIYVHTARGMVPERMKIPVLLPVSVKDTYLDESSHVVMNEGTMVGPGIIRKQQRKYEDLVLDANRGSNDPDSMDGGWMPANVRKVEKDNNGHVTLLEFEGDLVVPRKTVRSIFIPGAVVTVALESKKVVRFRFRKEPFSSYIAFPYHKEEVGCPYGASPLMKGRLIQLAATQGLNRMMDAAALSIQPPIGYNKDDLAFASRGPNIEPGASWETTDGITVHDFADPSRMFPIYAGLLAQYSDVTGVNAPRLGAQTVSHTTAFAKEAELNRGVVRTVDYVNSTLNGGLQRFLHMEYQLARKSMKEQVIYIEPYRGFVRITPGEDLPDTVVFDVFGSGGPAEEQQKKQERFAAAQAAIQLDLLRIQTGKEPILDHAELIKQFLTEGGWTDIDPIINDGTGAVPAGTPESPPMATDTGQLPGIATEGLPTQ